MEKLKTNTGIFIMVGLIVLGCCIPAAVGKFMSYQRTVSVKGLCEREVPADKVIWPLSFKVVGDDLTALYNEIETKQNIILGFLSEGGIPEKDITVPMPKISDKFAQEYGGNDRQFRYVATCIITVCSSDVDSVMKLMSSQSKLIKKNIALYNDWDNNVQFRFEGLNAIKPGMIEEATKNARAVAEKFAKDSGSGIGRIKDAAQGTFSIEDRDSNTPSIKKVRVVTYVTYYLSK